MKAAELVERTALVAEHVAHQVLDASGEQAGDPRRVVQRLPQSLGGLLGVAIRPAGQLLELVDEQDQLSLVALGDALGQLEGETEFLQWVAAFPGPGKGTRGESARSLYQPLER